MPEVIVVLLEPVDVAKGGTVPVAVSLRSRPKRFQIFVHAQTIACLGQRIDACQPERRLAVTSKSRVRFDQLSMEGDDPIGGCETCFQLVEIDGVDLVVVGTG